MISFAHAATNAAQPTGFFAQISAYIPLAIILLVFWFLVLRPQQQRYKKHQKMVSELKRGDKVITSSGILGRITKVSDRFFTIEIAPDIEVQVERSAISDRYDPTTPAENDKK